MKLAIWECNHCGCQYSGQSPTTPPASCHCDKGQKEPSFKKVEEYEM